MLTGEPEVAQWNAFTPISAFVHVDGEKDYIGSSLRYFNGKLDVFSVGSNFARITDGQSNDDEVHILCAVGHCADAPIYWTAMG
jgi:hypothetical protein